MVTEAGHISGMLTEGQDVKTSLIRQIDRPEGQVLVIADRGPGSRRAAEIRQAVLRRAPGMPVSR